MLYNMLDITKTDTGLLLEVKRKKDRKELLKEYKDPDKAEYYIWSELLEPYSCNGSYHPISAEDIVALTSDPYLLADTIDIDDDGTVTPIGDIYHFPYYMTHSVIEELAIHGKCELNKVN